MLQEDVVPPSLEGWSIFRPVYSCRKSRTNFNEFLSLAEVADHLLDPECKWFTSVMNHRNTHVYEWRGEAGIVSISDNSS